MMNDDMLYGRIKIVQWFGCWLTIGQEYDVFENKVNVTYTDGKIYQRTLSDCRSQINEHFKYEIIEDNTLTFFSDKIKELRSVTI